MKKKSLIGDLVIRTAVVRTPDVGHIFCCDLKKEDEDIPHAITFRCNSGKFNQGSRNYDAHSICIIKNPELSVVDVSGQGYYSVNTGKGLSSGDILEDSQPPARKRRFGGFKSLAEIEGKAYAVGLRGRVYRLDDLKKWTRIDEGLPDTFNIQASHGFEANDIYTVGRDGELWHYNGKK